MYHLLLPPPPYLKHRINFNFTILPTSIAEIMTLILQLDDSKAPGPRDIPIKILKITAHVVKIINKSFELGLYPNSLKLGKVIPIFKAGSKLEVNNYRPISLLPTLSKIIEKLIHIDYFKGKSTMHSLIELVEKIRNCMRNKNYGCGIFIDLKKAFNTVNHNILIQKLEHYGVRDTTLNWFRSYLKGRLLVVYPKVLYWAHYCFYYISMASQMSLMNFLFIYLLMTQTYSLNQATLILYKLLLIGKWANLLIG